MSQRQEGTIRMKQTGKKKDKSKTHQQSHMAGVPQLASQPRHPVTLLHLERSGVGGRLPRAQNSTFIYSFIHHDLVQGLLVPRLSHPLCSPTSSIDALLPLYLRCFELLKAGAVISGPVQHRRDPPWGQQFAEHLH